VTDEQKLLESLEAEAEEEREQLLADARAEAEAIVSKARREAEQKIEGARRTGEKRGAVEVDRRIGLARQEVDLAVLEEKRRLLDEVRGGLAARIGELRQHAEYADALKRWTAEVIAGMGDGMSLQVHPEDVAVVQDMLSERGLEAAVSGDAGITGGVRAVSVDGRVSADNTLGSRLERAREQLDAVLGRALFADAEVSSETD